MDSYSFGAASFFLFDFLFFFRGGKRKGDGRLLFNQRADEVVVPFRFDHNDDVIGVKIVEIDGKLICAAEQMHREDTVDAIFRANDAELHDEIFVGDLILRAEEHGDDEHEKKEAHKEEDPVLWYLSNTDRIPEPIRAPEEDEAECATGIGAADCGERGILVDELVTDEKRFFRTLRILAPVLQAYHVKVVVVNGDGVSVYECGYDFTLVDE